MFRKLKAFLNSESFWSVEINNLISYFPSSFDSFHIVVYFLENFTNSKKKKIVENDVSNIFLFFSYVSSLYCFSSLFRMQTRDLSKDNVPKKNWKQWIQKKKKKKAHEKCKSVQYDLRNTIPKVRILRLNIYVCILKTKKEKEDANKKR